MMSSGKYILVVGTISDLFVFTLALEVPTKWHPLAWICWTGRLFYRNEIQ